MSKPGKNPNDIRFYLTVLRSNGCQCGGHKKPRQALCWSCYRQLPTEMRMALYRPVGSGFEEAYEEAVKWLN